MRNGIADEVDIRSDRLELIGDAQVHSLHNSHDTPTLATS